MKRILAVVLALTICFGLVACVAGGDDAATSYETGKLKAAHQAVVDYFGDTYAVADVPEEMIKDMVGIDTTLAAEYIVQMPMMSVQNDLFIGIEAKDGNIDAVKAELDAKREALVSDMMQYPQNMIKTNASQVVVFGNYAFLLVLGNFDDTLTDDAAQLAHLEGQVNEVVAAIEAALAA